MSVPHVPGPTSPGPSYLPTFLPSTFLPSLSAILQFCNPAIAKIALVPRNAEVIRQWTILREIERARGVGVTIDDLASLCGVTTRTIRRDLQALEEAGFPLYDDRTHDDIR